MIGLYLKYLTEKKEEYCIINGKHYVITEHWGNWIKLKDRLT